MAKIVCRLCGKNAHECLGWLKRMNEVGVDGIWECRPSCDAAPMSNGDCVISAIEGGSKKR